MDESALIAAVLADRGAYETADRIGLDPSAFSEAGSVLLSAAREQYSRDAALKSVSRSVLRNQIVRRYGNTDIARGILDYLDQIPSEVSAVNIAEEYRLVQLKELGIKLASRLASGRYDDETSELLARYDALRAPATAGGTEAFRLTEDDFDESTTGRIPVMPGTLNRYIGGGIRRGHHVVVFGRPDSGKSLFTLNQSAVACAHGYKVLYVANEEPKEDITVRLLSRLTNRPIDSLRSREALREAFSRAKQEGYNNWHLLHKAGVTIADIRAAAGRIRPDIIVIDQLKNIHASDDNRSLQLDRLARAVRELGSDYDCAVFSVTQAGDSASGKLVLGMGDVDWSNTGIPGAADVMIGIGVNDEWYAQGKRMLTVCKNKANGKHGSVHCYIFPETTALRSYR